MYADIPDVAQDSGEAQHEDSVVILACHGIISWGTLLRSRWKKAARNDAWTAKMLLSYILCIHALYKYQDMFTVAQKRYNWNAVFFFLFSGCEVGQCHPWYMSKAILGETWVDRKIWCESCQTLALESLRLGNVVCVCCLCGSSIDIVVPVSFAAGEFGESMYLFVLYGVLKSLPKGSHPAWINHGAVSCGYCSMLR